MQRGEAVRTSELDDFLPQNAGFDTCAALLGVDLDAAHLPHVEQERSLE